MRPAARGDILSHQAIVLSTLYDEQCDQKQLGGLFTGLFHLTLYNTP